MGTKIIQLKDKDNNNLYPITINTLYESNDNLLDNWYFIGGSTGQFGNFPINQREQSSYSGSTSNCAIDRWWSTNSLTVSSNCINIITTEQWKGITQNFYKTLTNMPFTLSVLLKTDSNNKFVLGTDFYDSNNNRTIVLDGQWYGTGAQQLYSISGTYPSTQNANVKTRVYVWSTATTPAVNIEIYAIKLEIGTFQTLAHKEGNNWVINDIPDYREELGKCQSYLVKNGSYQYVRSAFRTADLIDFNFPVPREMYYGAPGISGTLNLANMSGTVQSGFTFACSGYTPGIVQVRATKTSHGVTDAIIFGTSTWFFTKEI